MNYQEYTTILKSQSLTQPYNFQLKFATLVCDKLYANYQNFSNFYNWGDPILLMNAINTCKDAINGLTNVEQIKSLLPKIDSIAPHMDDFGSEIGSYALNATGAVYETLEFIIDHDNIHIYNIATYFTDTIDFQIQEERTLTDLEIQNHPLMIEAWNFVINQTKNGY